MVSSGMLDIAREIKVDHDNVRDLFQRYQNATNKSEKAILANTLIREMAIHGDAEEVSVYNDYAMVGLGDAAAHNKEEHAEIKGMVHEADTTSVSKPEYDDILSRAVNMFLTHAKEEEEQQLPLISQKLSKEDNDKVARAFLKARKMVPTRAHPSAPQTGGMAQKAMGMQASIVDKVVEKMTGRDFAPLKYTHSEIST